MPFKDIPTPDDCLQSVMMYICSLCGDIAYVVVFKVDFVECKISLTVGTGALP